LPYGLKPTPACDLIGDGAFFRGGTGRLALAGSVLTLSDTKGLVFALFFPQETSVGG
jgi:hypothetical protein